MEQIYTKTIIDCENHTETVVPLTEEEIAEVKKNAAEAELSYKKQLEEQVKKEELKAIAKQKLMSLGLTEAEIGALL